jgi:hypothetical protein
MSQSKHLGTITIREHEIRFVLDTHARRGVYAPELHIHLKGPNGSPAGVGPKGWPQPLADLFRPYHQAKAAGRTCSRSACLT